MSTSTAALATPVQPRRIGLDGRGRAGLVLIGVVVLLGVFGPLVAGYGVQQQIPGANLLTPGHDPAGGLHLLGTDGLNRDVLARLLSGIRIDLAVALLAVPLGAVAGSAVGVLATWWAPLDVVAQRAFDVLLAFPAVILAIAVTAISGPGLASVVTVIVLVEIPVFGRLLRSSVLGVRDLPYVDAALVSGAGNGQVLRRHVLPNSLEPVLVQLALSMSVAVFVEGAMSFIGIGIRPPTPSLGTMLADSLSELDANPFFAAGPLVVVAVLILGFQLVAQSLAARRRVS